jgi:signal transduction histidine kinase
VGTDRIPLEYAGPIDICLREVQRLDRVAGGVLSIARTQPRERVPSSVHTALNEALEALRPQLDERLIDVQSEFAAESSTILGDAEQLKGVFLNLFLNALDAMPHGGALEVRTELTREAKCSTVRVRIADTGPGVPPEVRDKIFEPFVSTKEEGTGFGLALAQQAVEEHGGALRLEHTSSDRPGAVFVVELPLAVEEVTR